MSFLPTREAELALWSTNYNNLIAVNFASYGLTLQMSQDYTTKHDDFIALLQVASDGSTATPSAIVNKNIAKRELIAEARKLARIIQANPAVTDGQRSDLGLTVRDVDPTPVPAPQFAPVMDVVSRSGWNVTVRVHDSQSDALKPAGVLGVTVFSYVGETAPVNIGDWKYHGMQTRTTVSVEFPTELAPGTKVWLTAFWYNRRGESGPGSPPMSALIAGEQMQAAA